MIRLRRRSWLAGVGMAVALHVAFAAAWLWQPPAEGTVATGAGGVHVGLASAGAPAGAAGEAAPETAAEARPETAEAAAPETVTEQSPVEAAEPDVVEAATAQPVEAARPEVVETPTPQAAEAVTLRAVEQVTAAPVELPAPEPVASSDPSIEPVRAEPVEQFEIAEARPVAVTEPETVEATETVTAEPVEQARAEVVAAEPVEQAPVEIEAVEATPAEPEQTEVAAVAPPVPAPRPDRPAEARPRQPVPKESLPQRVATATADIAEPQGRRADSGEDRPAAAQQAGEGRQAALPGALGRSGSKAGQNAGDGPGQQSGGGSPGERADYLARLQLWLERHKKYPRKAERRRQEGTAKLFFIMSRDGTVLDFRIEESSGHRLLDREVEAMIRRAQPLPVMPGFIDGQKLELVVPVVFSLR